MQAPFLELAKGREVPQCRFAAAQTPDSQPANRTPTDSPAPGLQLLHKVQLRPHSCSSSGFQKKPQSLQGERAVSQY